MNKIDPDFTKKIQAWLTAEPKTDQMALEGALLLQQINPMNGMYRRWLSLAGIRPKYIINHIGAELKKHLKYRLDGMTREQVQKMDSEVIPESSKIISEGKPEQDNDTLLKNKDGEVHQPAFVVLDSLGNDSSIVRQYGRRPDHEQLPDEIKKLWDDDGNLYKNIKSLYEELKAMQNLPSCDRYEKLQLLASMDKKYFEQMKAYDGYVIGKKEEGSSEETVDMTKQVMNARSYLSKDSNRQNLKELQVASEKENATDEEKSAYHDLLDKMQQRVDIILGANAPITDDLKNALSDLGLKFNKDEDKSTETAQ
jgi:transcriptional regulator of met regulon